MVDQADHLCFTLELQILKIKKLQFVNNVLFNADKTISA